MKPLLSPSGMKILRGFAGSRTAVILDYDGTIAPIVRHQTRALISPKTALLVSQVARLYPTAVLSGRKLSDVRKRMPGIPVREIVGNHGLEWKGSASSKRMKKQVVRWKRAILHAVDTGIISKRGLELEDKGVSLSLHYRCTTNPAKTREQIENFLHTIPGLRAMPGKMLFNIVPNVNVNKGTALLKLRKKLRCDRVIYVGDDRTDEDVFALPRKSFLLDVRVGKSSLSSARYFLHAQPQIDRLLEALVDFRAENGSNRR